MAPKEQWVLPRVSLFTHYEQKKIAILVTSVNGDLSLHVYADGPTISFQDPQRGPLRCKAICELFAHGRLKGWFVEHKGATSKEETLVFFPAAKHHKKQPLTARKVKR
jgi:hypothetical protein